MSRLLDNVSSTPQVHGSRIDRAILKEDGNYYATEITRTMMCAPATAYATILQQRTALTALLKYSDDLSQSAWTKTNTSATSGATTDPEGGTSASKLAETNANAAHNASQALVVSAGKTGFGVIAKAGERSFIRLRLNNGTDGDLGATVFNLSTGEVVSGTGTITALRNGWFWCYITPTPTVANSTAYVDLSSDGTTFSYTGTTGSGVYLFHATSYRCTEMGPALYTGATTRAVSSPPVDFDDPLAFLTDETEPQASAAEVGVAIWQRRYTHVPRQTTIPSSQFITKPGLSGTFPQVFGDSLVIQPDENAEKWDFYSRKEVVDDSGPVTDFFPSGGSYTLTFEGYTTAALDFDATALEVQTALNALTSVSGRGGVVVTGAYNSSAGFTITFNPFSTANVSVDVGSLVSSWSGGVYGSVAADGYTGGFAQNVFIQPIAAGTAMTVQASLSPSYLNPFYVGTSEIFADRLTFLPFFGIPLQVAEYATIGGTFTVTARGQTTSPITWGTPVLDGNGWIQLTTSRNTSHPGAVAIAAALNALSNVQAIGTAAAAWMAIQSNQYPQRVMIRLTPPRITGGTFTITIAGQTTAAIAYNASLSAIESALNALSAVSARGGCRVTGQGYVDSYTDWMAFTSDSFSTGLRFRIEFPYQQLMTVNSSLTPNTSTAAVAAGNVLGTVQTLKFGAQSARRLLQFIDHGITNSDTIYLEVDGETIEGVESPTFEVQDSNIIAIPVTPGSFYATATAITYAGKKTTVYTGGVKLTRVKRVTDYYLPGITPDIDEVDDIPLPTWEGDDVSLLEAILNGSTSINYEVGDLERWKGDIVRRPVTTLNASTL